MAEISDRLRQARAALGLNQEQFAKKIGIKLSTFQYWEQGHSTKLSIEALENIESLGIDITWLVTGKGQTPPHTTLRERFPATFELHGSPPEAPGTAEPTPAPAPDHGLTAAALRVSGAPVPPELASAEALGLELAAWLRRQAVRRPGSWPKLEQAIEDFRSRWETEGRASPEESEEQKAAG